VSDCRSLSHPVADAIVMCMASLKAFSLDPWLQRWSASSALHGVTNFSRRITRFSGRFTLSRTPACTSHPAAAASEAGALKLAQMSRSEGASLSTDWKLPSLAGDHSRMAGR